MSKSYSVSGQTCLEDVRESTKNVLEGAKTKHVEIDFARMKEEVESNPDIYTVDHLPSEWSQDYHFSDGTDDTAQYILVLDALNFCFWPLPEYEYNHLASSLKKAFEEDRSRFSAAHLQKVTGEELTSWLQVEKDQVIPLVDERARLLREIGRSLEVEFEGRAANLVRAAKNSAAALVALVTAHFPGFRDHTVHNGKQVFLYKRAQIFVGDLWGAYEGKGLGFFEDIDRLTCFADYRIPQLLMATGIFKYTEELKAKILNKEELMPGSDEEVQIRAATVQAVEAMRVEIERVSGKKTHAVQVDWLLWERGEEILASLPPHHRVLTIFY